MNKPADVNTDENFMRMAIEKARQGVDLGQSPFGACIIRDGTVISCEHNTVWLNTDITAHGEVNAVRKACKKLNSIDLSGCIIYSTCEPCPMCFTAIHWARIEKIVYGANIEDAWKFGFNELRIPNPRLKEMGSSKITLLGGLLRDECIELFEYWASKHGNMFY